MTREIQSSRNLTREASEQRVQRIEADGFGGNPAFDSTHQLSRENFKNRPINNGQRRNPFASRISDEIQNFQRTISSVHPVPNVGVNGAVSVQPPLPEINTEQ